jgi:hypothetical protein
VVVRERRQAGASRCRVGLPVGLRRSLSLHFEGTRRVPGGGEKDKMLHLGESLSYLGLICCRMLFLFESIPDFIL